MRLFTAVLPPESAAAELARSVDRVRALPGADRLRWTDRAGWHLTLAFLGEVPDEMLPALYECLERAARRTAPFPLALHGGGRFGDRALWAGAAGDVAALRTLARRAEAAAREAGVVLREERAYRAHLTLARGRGEVDLRPFAAGLAAFAGEEWGVDRMVLVRSHLGAGARPRYEPLHAWPLAGGARG
ncbi:RNA 2',3'-cyclic phosphodiesterase [Streptomyces sp. G45]|uniref:RNA 2',3'-cyclic phosphodiesterase n=1 Tax=Streptomyces sp. G45 TaxID=3406627 RepID=UPI003C148899